MATRRMHFSASAGFLRSALTRAQANGHEQDILTLDGVNPSFAAALDALANLPDDHLFPVGDCDHFDPKRGCLGHPVNTEGVHS